MRAPNARAGGAVKFVFQVFQTATRTGRATSCARRALPGAPAERIVVQLACFSRLHVVDAILSLQRAPAPMAALHRPVVQAQMLLLAPLAPFATFAKHVSPTAHLPEQPSEGRSEPEPEEPEPGEPAAEPL